MGSYGCEMGVVYENIRNLFKSEDGRKHFLLLEDSIV
jgi:hypothetical protein